MRWHYHARERVHDPRLEAPHRADTRCDLPCIVCRPADAVLLADRRQLRRSPIRRPGHVRIKKASISSLRTNTSTLITPATPSLEHLTPLTS